ncbi:MAG: hypothetical protein M0Z98_13930 [Actinomycetales bacterium]|nr:hypothetical protein [Actinomycetales bacterium]
MSATDWTVREPWPISVVRPVVVLVGSAGRELGLAVVVGDELVFPCEDRVAPVLGAIVCPPLHALRAAVAPRASSERRVMVELVVFEDCLSSSGRGGAGDPR